MTESNRPPHKRREHSEHEHIEVVYERAPSSPALLAGVVVASIVLLVVVIMLILRLTGPAGTAATGLQGGLQGAVEQGGSMAQPDSAAEEAARLAAAPVVPEGVFYVGQKVCEKCHKEEAKKMATVRMSTAIDRLIKSVDVPNAMKEPGCLGCHTTGYLLPWAPGLDERKIYNVQCEACHGPGSEYVKHMQKKGFKKDDPKTRELTAKAGLVATPNKENTCLRCHHNEPGRPAWDYDSHREYIRHWKGP